MFSGLLLVICAEEERQCDHSYKKASLPIVSFGFSVLSLINCFQNCVSIIKQQNQRVVKIWVVTQNNQNVTITASTIIIPSLLGLMTDSHSSLKLSIQVLCSSEFPAALGNSSNTEQIPKIKPKFF